MFLGLVGTGIAFVVTCPCKQIAENSSCSGPAIIAFVLFSEFVMLK